MMENGKKIRSSNIELLRIVSIIFILIHHYSLHNQLNNLDIFNINKYVGIIAFGLGKIGVNIFILIMGYFSIERNLSVKKILKLWLQVFFYSFGIAVIFKLLLNTNISIKEWINFIFPISYNKYWFITIYIFLYLLTPWLNHYFNKINKEEYKKILIMLFGVLIVFYSIFYKSTAYSMNELMPYSNLLVFMFLYLLGGYIKKYDITKLKAMKQGKLALSLIIIFIIFYLFLITCEIIDYKYNKLGGVLYWYTRQTSIFVFISNSLLFILFLLFKFLFLFASIISFICLSLSSFSFFFLNFSFSDFFIFKNAMTAIEIAKTPHITIKAMKVGFSWKI